jgi:hypothetical protein
MSYEQLKDLPPAEFKRYCGVQPETFRRMVEVVSTHLRKRRRVTGRPTKLAVEDQVLLTLEYWREYRTFFHLAKNWGLHESSVCRTTRRVEDILTKSRAFKLPGKKVLEPSDHEIESVVVDVAETPVERPKKSRSLTTAARRSGTR